MTDEARMNLQKGVPENPFYPATTYNIESNLDKFVWQKQRNMDSVKREKEQKTLNEYMEKQIEDILEKKMDELLDGFQTLSEAH